MFLPLKDLNPRRTYPIVNTALILANFAVFLFQSSLSTKLSQAFVLAHATIPAQFPAWVVGHGGNFISTFLPLLTSIFIHAGIVHLLGNMLFLWIFGDNVEDYFGHFLYLLFYLGCGLGSGLLHVLFNSRSILPAVGASGAISGVMGAYLVLYPRARVLTLVLVFLVPVPAVAILVLWFAMQLLSAFSSIGATTSGGVAWWAHVGGFLMGMFLAAFADRTPRGNA